MNDSTLNFDDLLAPIHGEQPAGDESAYRYYLRDQINELRREEIATDFDDATRPAQLKRADWPAVVQLCEETLQCKAKDLRVACHLLEALVKLRGFSGLRDGLTLLVRLLDECWEGLLPPLENGDAEERAVMLQNLLDDPDRGVLFPNIVRGAPLFGTDEARFSLAEWTRIGTMEKGPEKEEIQRALNLTPASWTDRIASEVDACEEEFTLLIAASEARMGESSPGLTNLRTAINDCRKFVRECLKHQPAASEVEPSANLTEGSHSAGANAVPAPPGGIGIGSRSEAYSLLASAADALAKIEPHSPTPYLVRRAIELGRLPFPKWIPSLMREESALAELMRGVEQVETAGSR